MKLSVKIGYGVFFLMLAFLSAGLFMRVGIDSDYANLVFEARDILSGNIFLKDWNQTGISFLTTDLPYFILGVLLAGTTPTAYLIAVSAMFVVLFFSLALLLPGGMKKPLFVLLLFSIGGIPTVFGCNVLRAHTAAASLSFLAIFFLERFRASPQKKSSLVLGGICLTLGCIGDPLTILVGAVPLLAVYLRLIFSEGNNRKFYWALLGVTAGSVPLGLFLERMYYLFGKANKNEFLSHKMFNTLDGLGDKFKLWLTSVFQMAGADFWGKPLVSLNTLWYFLRTLLLLGIFWAVLLSIWEMLFKKRWDVVSGALSLGLMLISFLCIITDVLVSAEASRYYGFFLLSGGTVFIRQLERHGWLDLKLFHQKLSSRWVAAAIGAAFIFGGIGMADIRRPAQFQDRLGQFLLEQGLTDGYAKFWNASHVTLSTKEQVRVRAILSDGKILAKHNWFCKNEWYEPEYANFVIVDKSEDVFRVNSASVVKALGNPRRILEFEDVRIYVYNRNIADEIVH